MKIFLTALFCLFASLPLSAEESDDIFQTAFAGAIATDVNGRFQDFMWVRPTFPRVGMFAFCNLVLGHLYFLDKGYYRGLGVDLENTGVYYEAAKGPNWWTYYFKPLHINSEIDLGMDSRSSIPDKGTLGFELNRVAAALRMHIPREEAHALIKKYIQVQDYILEEAEKFKTANFQDFFIIGIHYRGTDKSTEAPRTTYKQVEQAVFEQISLLSHDQFMIFIATDEQPFLNYMLSKFPDKVICTEATRSTDFTSIHHHAPNHYEIGKQAIVDALLLSKCHLLIRTSSNLGLWATYFNPDLPVVLLNHRFGSLNE